MPDAVITVLLVDDHGLVRRGFRRMLEDEPGIQVVGKRATATTPWRLRPGSTPRSSSWISRCPA